MRQRAITHRDAIIEENKKYIVQNPKEIKGHWHDIFSDSKTPVYIEIGSGKGQFITGMALAHPGRNFLACEGALNVAPRILQKANSSELQNLMVITEYIIEPSDYFEKGELAGVYLNFCDPWPKDRHAHRRLTHVKKLLQYKEIMSPGSTLEFKTDNNELFDFSLEQVELAGLKCDFVTRDLHKSELAAANITTEYEDKFAAQGLPINYFRIVF